MRRLVWLLLIGSALAQTTVAPNTTVFPNSTLFAASAGGGTTVTYASNGAGSNNANPAHLIFAVQPSAGRVVAGVVWLPNGTTLASIADGGSTYTIKPVYANGANFNSYTFYTCNFAGTSGDISLTLSGAAQFYVAGISASGNSTSSCEDGYNKAQDVSGAPTTTWTSGTVTTTNSADLLIGLFTNECGVADFTAGTDGSGHSYTYRIDQTLVSVVETITASATGTYSASGSTTTTGCKWNAEILAIK
jgi:hypothetical protein